MLVSIRGTQVVMKMKTSESQRLLGPVNRRMLLMYRWDDTLAAPGKVGQLLLRLSTLP